VELFTNGSLLRTRETVLIETPALLATSLIVAEDKESLFPIDIDELRRPVLDSAVIWVKIKTGNNDTAVRYMIA